MELTMIDCDADDVTGGIAPALGGAGQIAEAQRHRHRVAAGFPGMVAKILMSQETVESRNDLRHLAQR